MQGTLVGQTSFARSSLTSRVEDVVGADFGVQKFVENFDVLVNVAGSVKHLKKLVLQLAVRGGLSPRGAESADPLLLELQRARAKLGKSGVRVGDRSLPVSDEEAPHALPPGWRWVRLRDLGGFLGGGTPAKSNAAFWEGPLPWVSPKDMKRPYINDAEDHISVAAVEASAVKLIPPHSLLYVVRGMILAHSFPVAIATRELTINQDMKAVVLAMPELSEFVLRSLQAARRRVLAKVERSSHGTCRLESEAVEMLPLALPPLAEQKRIVAKVDQLMALCDELEARQTKKREVGTRLTKSALDSLTSADGPEEFDAAWKRVIENFDLLLDRAEKVVELKNAVLRMATTGILSPSGGSTWKRRAVADVADCRLGKMLDKAKNRGSQRPYLRNTNVHWFRLELGSIKQMPFTDDELVEYELRAGDLVVCEGGHGIGRTAVWRGELAPMMFQKALHRVRPRPFMDSLFLAYQFKVAADTGVMSTYFTGAGIPHLTGRRLAEMSVTIPPIDEQVRLVEKVQNLLNICDVLEARLRRAESKGAELLEAAVQDLAAQGWSP